MDCSHENAQTKSQELGSKETQNKCIISGIILLGHFNSGEIQFHYLLNVNQCEQALNMLKSLNRAVDLNPMRTVSFVKELTLVYFI